jgi:hypothetical protein
MYHIGDYKMTTKTTLTQEQINNLKLAVVHIRKAQDLIRKGTYPKTSQWNITQETGKHFVEELNTFLRSDHDETGFEIWVNKVEALHS